MSHGYPNQGAVPTYDATRIDDEPLFTSPPEERLPSMSRPPQQVTTSAFGAPPMGEPSVPSAHPDNVTAATLTAGGPLHAAGQPVDTDGTAGTPLGRSQSSGFGAFTKPVGGGGGLRRQASGAHDASTAANTDKAFFSGATHKNAPQQAAPQPGVAGPTPVGVQPGSPYVQTQEVPSTGTSKSL